MYFDEATHELAARLRQRIQQDFSVRVGRLHTDLVGPHPMWSCQIVFDATQFDALIPWLDAEREGLSVLVHAVTGDDYLDHTAYVYWLGQSVPLNVAFFDS
jgi:DOPA 4,5-dioxygenase